MKITRQNAPRTSPVFWLETRYPNRFIVTATNNTGLDLEDGSVQVSIPSGASFTAYTVRVVDITSFGAYISHGWRYQTQEAPNNFVFVPVTVQSGTLTIKALGKWKANERRYWGVYWSGSSPLSAITYKHLNVIAQNYTAAVTLGSVGDVYSLNLNGTVYSYTTVSGDTALTIATNLANTVNAGTLANASSGGTSTITFSAKQPQNPFSATSTGTVPGNLIITKPPGYVVERVGPSTDIQPYNYLSDVYLPNGPIFPWNNVGIYSSSNHYQFMLPTYYVGATRYGFTSATQSSVSLQDNQVVVQGNLGDPTSRLTGTYTATYKHHFPSVLASDGSGTWTIYHAPTVKWTMTINVANSFTSGNSEFVIFRLWDFNENGASPSGYGYGTIPYFYQVPGGSITNAGQGVGNATIPLQSGVTLGCCGPNYIQAFKIDSVSVQNFSGVSARGLVVNSDSYGFSIAFEDMSTTTPIPNNASVTLSVTVMFHFKNAAASATNMQPVDATRVLQSAYPVIGTAGSVETVPSDSVTSDIRNLMTMSFTGARWFQTNASSYGGVSWNAAYQYDLQALKQAPCDDDDSSYGQGHLLHALVLRYLRTQDANLIPVIEYIVQYFIKLNQLLETRYGSVVYGMISYWVWPGPGPVTYYNPDTNKSTIYNVGDPNNWSSLEQMHMSAQGLWAYVNFLSNQPIGLFPNMQNAITLLGKMQQFEESQSPAVIGQYRPDIPSNAYVIGNALYMATAGKYGAQRYNGATATVANTASGMPWSTITSGQYYTQWIQQNATNITLNTSANTMLIGFLQALWAPDTTNAGILQFLHTWAVESIVEDFYYHQAQTDSSTATWGNFLNDYPVGWASRTNFMTGMYNAANTPTHYILLNNGGARDALYGRVSQMCVFLALLALFDPSYNIPIDGNNTVNVINYLNDRLHLMSVYMTEPTTGAQRRGCARYFGTSSAQPDMAVDATYHGYYMLACELWYLVQERLAGRLNPATYYRFPGTYTG